MHAKAGSTLRAAAGTINANAVTMDSSGNVSIPGTLTVTQNVPFNGGAP
jgi:hypothetical protein